MFTESKFEKVEIYKPVPKQKIVDVHITRTIASSPINNGNISSVKLRSLSKNSNLTSTNGKNMDKIQTPRRGMFKRTSSLSVMNPSIGMFSKTTNFEELSQNQYQRQYRGEAYDEGVYRNQHYSNTSAKKYDHYRQYTRSNRAEIELNNPERYRKLKKKALRGSEVGCCACGGDQSSMGM